MPKRKNNTPLKHQWCDAIMSESGPASGYTRLVLIAMSRHCARDRDRFFVSQQQLAKETALSDRTVRARIENAINEGWIERIARGRSTGRPGEGYASTYRLKLPEAFSGSEVHQPEIASGSKGDQPEVDGPPTGNSFRPAVVVNANTGRKELPVGQDERNRRGMRHLKEIIKKPAAMGNSDADS